MNNSALIFIPDISGYTEFITQTEIRHSKHIISELLEIILNGNQLAMNVSEIEGDAVLFYRKGDAPSLKEIIAQVKKMFVDFHTHLKIIQRDNVCQCGACRSAINLTLKFIIHYGVLDETVIGNFSKIIGSDVILAHRLMKNSIDAKEYMLVTENYWKFSNSIDDVSLELEPFKDHTEAIENFDNVNLKYTTLSSIRKNIPKPVLSDKQKFYKEKPDTQVNIKASMLLVHELLTDIDAKMNYVPNLRNVSEASPINRVNSSHTCVFDDLEIHFVTLSNENKQNEINYTEEANLSLGAEYISDYRMKESQSGTNLDVRIFPKQKVKTDKSFAKKIVDDLKEKLVLIRVKNVTKKNIVLFKNYCERIAIEREN
ncbi:MAG: DUF2652 domain-containing protein [Ignavibacteriaceae bacterium]|nr:DUF2652 domain-containing protein [Ignavibacteria bacterium]NNL19730.1 DUF2652 domain-containing protein [Ignavibacteriaceae bacterium]